jgi:hypothetical protein
MTKLSYLDQGLYSKEYLLFCMHCAPTEWVNDHLFEKYDKAMHYIKEINFV